MNICDIDQCTGCSACLNVCSHGAISMGTGVNGHLFPKIDKDKCVGCNLCVNTCPNNTLPEFHTPISSYIATAVDGKEALTSTSAGIASVFSQYIIEKGGVVYGSCGWDCQHIRHIRVASQNDIDKLKGSKYVQSAIEDTFLLVKNDLDKGTIVLFIGTPCQVAGLYGFLRKKYDNLYTVDLICHGVPSQKILIDALHDYLPKTDLNGLRVSFRKKEKGKSLYGLFVDSSVGKELYRSVFPTNEYIVGFLYGLYYRESCYQCHYSRPERVSDITIGDYWDKQKRITLPNSDMGLSMLIVNTPQGMRFKKECATIINTTVGDYSDFVRRNGQLHHPIKKNSFYDSFAAKYPLNGFLYTAKTCLKNEKKRIKKLILRSIIVDFIMKVPGTAYIINKIRKTE